MEVAISDIEIPSGRELRTDVAALADSINQIGLLNPITVRATEIYEPGGARGGYLLVAGLHRLEATRLLGRENIAVVVVDLEDLEYELVEIDENLIRLDIPLIDRADRLERRQQIYETFHSDATHGGDRKSQEYKEENQTANLATLRFAKETAEKTGMSERAVQRLTQISKGVGHDLKAEIRDTPLAYNQDELVKLARIKDPKEQRASALAYISGEADSITVPKKRAPTKTERQQAADALATILIEHIPSELWPQIGTYLKLDKATVTLSAFRKLQKGAAS